MTQTVDILRHVDAALTQLRCAHERYLELTQGDQHRVLAGRDRYGNPVHENRAGGPVEPFMVEAIEYVQERILQPLMADYGMELFNADHPFDLSNTAQEGNP